MVSREKSSKPSNPKKQKKTKNISKNANNPSSILLTHLSPLNPMIILDLGPLIRKFQCRTLALGTIGLMSSAEGICARWSTVSFAKWFLNGHMVKVSIAFNSQHQNFQNGSNFLLLPQQKRTLTFQKISK